MAAKLVVRVHPDEHVEVKVEGLTARDQPRTGEQKLCKKVTRRLEEDLGTVTQCVYSRDFDDTAVELTNQDKLELGH